jgi:hypothetical protein
MVTDNLLEFLNEIQKLALKAKVQNILDISVKDDRVHDVLNADVVIKYYTKMYEHYEKNPQDFLFPNREWLRESLKRLKVDLSNVFDKCANVDHIKREEVIVLFMLLWVNMVIQNPIRIEVIKDPYDLFYIWTKNRVFIARPTDAQYLQDGDRRVLDRLGKSYGWFTGVHHFSIGLKGAVEYHYSSPDDITNINGVYNKTHGSVKKLRGNFKGFSFGRSDKNSVRYMMNWAQDRTDKLLTELADNSLEEKHRSRNIARNTKFVVREMTGMSNKDYKAFLKKFKEKEVTRYDETSQCFEDILKISSLEFDHEVILEAVDVYNRNVYHLNKALLKLKEKLNEG